MDHDNVPYREVTTTRYLYSGKALDSLTQRVAALEVAQADRDFDGHDAACARGIEMAAAALDRVAKLEKNHIADAGKMVADPPADARLRELAEAVVHYYEATDPKSRAVQVLSAYLRETAR